MNTTTQSGVTLVLGPPNSGKRGLAVQWWQERLGSRPLVVMPTAPDALEMSTELARRVGGLVGHSQALTFTGLAQSITGGSRRIIGEFERTLLVHRLLGSLPLASLAAMRHLPGVVGAAGKLLQELAESGRTTAELGELLVRWAKVDPSSASLAHDVLGLVEGYHKEMERRGLVDQAALVQEASAVVGGWTRPVALCGFTSFTQGQRRLVERLSCETEVLVTLDHDRARDVGLCSRGEVEWWMAHAASVSDVGPHARTYASAAVTRLEHHLLGSADIDESSAPTTEEEGVRFLLSAGRRAEAEAVSEEIARLIRSGTDPGGIAVVVRELRTWGRLLGDVFDSCGIPYKADERRRLGETGLGYAFLQALRGVASDDVDALLSFLKSPYCDAVRDDVHDLEARYRRGVGRGVAVLGDLVGRRLRNTFESLCRLVSPADAGVETAGTTAIIPSTAARRVDMVAAGALAKEMLLAAAKGAAVGCSDMEADARAYAALAEALSLMAQEWATCDVEETLRLLTQVTVSSSAQRTADAVQIISAQRARARRFDAVFVIGLAEGEFPGLNDEPSLLNTAQRKRLDSLASGLFPSEPNGERALFIGAATRAWRLLYLSGRDAEDDGTETIPSRFWTEAKSVLAAGDDGHERRSLADQVFSPHSSPSLRHYLRACVADGLDPRHESVAAPSWLRRSTALSVPEVLSELESLNTFSPSALESYARCPYAWFVERIVGRQEFETELDGRVLGDLIHGALSACYRSLKEDGLLPLRSTDIAEAESRAATLIDEATQGPDCPGTLGERRIAGSGLRDMVHRLFLAESEAESSLIFDESEVEVGGREGVDIGGLRVRGRVDRIDTDPDGHDLFVFDYKSGAIPSISAIGSDEALQLPLYLLALAAERQDAQVVGGAYLSLRQGAVSGVVSADRQKLLGTRAGRCRVVDDPEWQTLAQGALSVAQAAAQGMREGSIAPRPDRVCPSWCDLDPVCRSRQGGGRRP